MILGVDPGKMVYLALLDENGDAERFHEFSMEVPSNFYKTWDRWDLNLNACHVVIEDVHGMPYQDLTSQTMLVGSKWHMIGWCAALEVPYTLAAPSAWKREMGLTANKHDSVRLAAAYWPKWKDLFKMKDGHNYAEAALLAAYYLHMEQKDD